MNTLTQTLGGGLAIALMASAAFAQTRPKVELTPVVGADGVVPGGSVRVALRVALPPGVHMQSNRPRDPLLIPTQVTVEPLAGVTASQVVYPPATDFVLAGQSAPLAVFEQQFVVGVELAIGKEMVAGPVQVPLRVRYQACDASTCYPPARLNTVVALRVVPPGTTIKSVAPELFSTLRFRR